MVALSAGWSAVVAYWTWTRGPRMPEAAVTVLASCRGVLGDAAVGDVADLLGAAEGGRQVQGEALTEPGVEVGHDADVGAGESVDGLPVVAHGEQALPRLADQVWSVIQCPPMVSNVRGSDGRSAAKGFTSSPRAIPRRTSVSYANGCRRVIPGLTRDPNHQESRWAPDAAR